MLILLSQNDLSANPLINETFLNKINNGKDITSCSITGDNSFFVFSRVDKKGLGSLFFTQCKKGKWDNVSAFRALNSDFDDISPYISPDGKFILFSSNRPGSLRNKFTGRQSYGIYYSERKGRDWTEPVLLYGAVNSDHDELYPFMTKDGKTLYFSRQMGNNSKTIIIKAQKVGASWENLQTVEITNNTNADILMYREAMHRPGAYVIALDKDNSSHKRIFYTDDAHSESSILIPLFGITGIGNDEIFVTELNENQIVALSNSGGKYNFFISKVNLEKEIIAAKNANFRNNLSMKGNNNVNVSAENDTDLEKDILPVRADFFPEKEFIARPVFFDFNSTNIDTADIPYLHQLLYLLRNNKSVQLDLTGYSDGTGSYKANMDISLKRAEKVKEYLEKYGIEKGRIKARGSGYITSSINDTAQYNRRVEIMIRWE